MPMWKNTDAAGNSVIWAPSLVNKTPNRTQANLLFGNTTSNAYIKNLTVGMYGVDKGEMRAVRTGKVARPAHAGWVLKRTKGTRIMYETLVAMKSITSDSENTSFPTYALTYVVQPANSTVNASSASANQAFVSASPVSVPNGATLTYYWQRWNGSAFANVTANATYANVTNTVLVISANTLATNTDIVRLVVATANSVIANNVASANAYITKTT